MWWITFKCWWWCHSFEQSSRALSSSQEYMGEQWQGFMANSSELMTELSSNGTLKNRARVSGTHVLSHGLDQYVEVRKQLWLAQSGLESRKTKFYVMGKLLILGSGFFFFFFFLRWSLTVVWWSAMAWSRLTATSASWFKAILLPQPPYHFFVFLVETGFHHIGQAGLELLTLWSARLSLPKY